MWSIPKKSNRPFSFHILVPREREPNRQIVFSINQNPRVGVYYLIGAMVLILLIVSLRPWAYLLLWPAASLLIVGLSYFGPAPWVYGKKSGKNAWWAKGLHFFTLLGHEISRRAYAKGCDPWNTLSENILIGRQLTREEAALLQKEGVTAVLDLTAEFSEPKKLRELQYLNLTILDLTAPSDQQLDAAFEFINRNIIAGKVYIHCKIGYSRTAAIAGSYLVQSGRVAGADEAISLLRKARPGIVIRPEAKATIESCAARCHQS